MITKLYPGRTVRGPYFAKDKGRYYVQLYWEDGRYFESMNLARFIMQEHLGRVLLSSEHVDHKDENKTNDVVDNLQILTQAENNDKCNRKYEPEIIEQCVWCGEFFTMSDVKQRLWKYKQRQGKAGPFCTASHAAKYNASVRYG